jgi:aspartate/methionine/tyrosine aminotransferase
MKLKDFAIERYFAKYEFSAKYMLSSSDCDGFSMAEVLSLASEEEKKDWLELKLGYTETRGSTPLRRAIQKHYQHIELDEIIVTSPGEANFVLMNVLLSKGDEVVCMAPMYQSLYQIAKDIGCTLKLWEPSESNGVWTYTISDLENLVSKSTQLVIVNFPHNPTGFSPSQEEYAKLIELCRNKDVYVFSDEMYRFLDHTSGPSLPSMSDLYEKSISLWGTSKTFGLAGVRIGWLTTKDKAVLQKVENFKDYLSICSSAPSEILATIALNNLDYFLTRNLNKIQQNIALFSKFQSKFPNLLEFAPPFTSSTAFIRLHLGVSAEEFAQKLVQETGIMLLPSEAFEYGNTHARIGFGRENFPEVLAVLENFLKDNNY